MRRTDFFKSLFGLALFRKIPEPEVGWRCLYCREPWSTTDTPPQGVDFIEGVIFSQENKAVMEMPAKATCPSCGCALRVKVGHQ